MWYKCLNKKCGFVFSRVGDCCQCPDCGKEMLREATYDEIQQMKTPQNEVSYTPNSM